MCGCCVSGGPFLRRRQSCLALLQDGDDLLFAVSHALHGGSPLLG